MVVFLFVYLCFALILNANICFRTMMMIGNSEILNLRIRLGIYFVFNVGFSVSGGCLVKVVNNAASVTRLNLSLRLHATIFKASRRAALPQLAFFAALARASESEASLASWLIYYPWMHLTWSYVLWRFVLLWFVIRCRALLAPIAIMVI